MKEKKAKNGRRVLSPLFIHSILQNGKKLVKLKISHFLHKLKSSFKHGNEPENIIELSVNAFPCRQIPLV